MGQIRLRSALVFSFAAISVVGVLQGCSGGGSQEALNKVNALDERVTRLEKEVDILANQINQRGKSTGLAPQPFDPTSPEARKLKNKKADTGRSYLTNGTILTLELGGKAKDGYGLTKTGKFLTPKGALPLQDLDLCHTQQDDKGVSKTAWPPLTDLVFSPGKRFGLLVFPCARTGENLYLFDLVAGAYQGLEYAGDLASTSTILWSPDSSYVFEESCRNVCNLWLLETTGRRVDLQMPEVFGLKPDSETSDERHPDCRLGGGEWTSNTTGKLTLNCSKDTGQAPSKPDEVQFNMTLVLDLLEPRLSIAQ